MPRPFGQRFESPRVPDCVLRPLCMADVADSDAERARGVSCATLDPLDIVTRFQMPPPPDRPEAERVTGYVEITEFLRGWLYFESRANPLGQLEYIIRRPVVWVISPFTDGPRFLQALLMTPGAVEITDVCN